MSENTPKPILVPRSTSQQSTIQPSAFEKISFEKTSLKKASPEKIGQDQQATQALASVNVCFLSAPNSQQLCTVDFLDANLYQFTFVHSVDALTQTISQSHIHADPLAINTINIILLATDFAMARTADVVSQLKVLLGERFVPIVLLSQLGVDDSSILISAMEAGAHDYIELPDTSVSNIKQTTETLFATKIAAQMRFADMQTLVQQQHAQIIEHHQHLMHEQQLAEEVFNKVSHNNGIDMANIRHWLSPIAVFNGDVLLAAPTPSGGLIVLLGDFTGHGLSAAIGAIPLASTFYSMVEKGFAMPDIIKELNAKLHAILPVSVFCCASVVQFNFDEGIVDIWNAGLPDSYVLRQNDASIETVASNGLALGIVGADEYQPKPTRFNLQAGDRLYLLSDGVLEATNSAGEQLGDKRLLEIIRRQISVDPDTGFSAIKQQVIDFIGGHSPADDISLVEVAMVNAADFAAMYQSTSHTVSADPTSWHVSFELRPDSLRYQDPIPLLLHLLMEVPSLRRYSGQLFTIINELYNNALEHGLLGLSSSLKQAPEGFKTYYQTRQQHLQQLAKGSVCFTLDYQGDDKQGALQVDVIDSGDGFDYAALSSQAALRQIALPDAIVSKQKPSSLSPVFSGRGIPMLQSICSKVEYLGCGNHARVQFKWPR